MDGGVMYRRIFSVCVFVASMAMCVLPASAQESSSEVSDDELSKEIADAPSAEAVDTAQRLMDDGAEAFASKNYAKATALFQKAYTYVPAADFLYNAARASQRLGNLEQAVEYLDRALRQKDYPLNSKNQARAEKMRLELKEEIAKRERARELAQAQGLDWRGWTGIGAGVVGLTGLTLGFVYGNQADEARDEAAITKQRSVYDLKVQDMEDAQSVGQTFLYSGLTLMAVGAGLVVWDLVDVPGAEADLSVGVQSGGAVTSVKVRW